MPQLFLDCDGVLADFDRGAREILGMSPDRFQQLYDPRTFWIRLERAPDFYARLPLLPDAKRLFKATKHLKPVILTGLPRGDWAAPQKQRWATQHFPGTPIITCMAVDKRMHANEGDVLVDDTLKHRHLWEEAGGIFIHHKHVDQTLEQLGRIFPLFEQSS